MGEQRERVHERILVRLHHAHHPGQHPRPALCCCGSCPPSGWHPRKRPPSWATCGTRTWRSTTTRCRAGGDLAVLDHDRIRVDLSGACPGWGASPGCASGRPWAAKTRWRRPGRSTSRSLPSTPRWTSRPWQRIRRRTRWVSVCSQLLLSVSRFGCARRPWLPQSHRQGLVVRRQSRGDHRHHPDGRHGIMPPWRSSAMTG